MLTNNPICSSFPFRFNPIVLFIRFISFFFSAPSRQEREKMKAVEVEKERRQKEAMVALKKKDRDETKRKVEEAAAREVNLIPCVF